MFSGKSPNGKEIALIGINSFELNLYREYKYG
jgi:hypothetical protein